MSNNKKIQIRNSTIDFLTFTKQAGEDGIEVRVQNENVWLTQDGIARLYDIDRSVVTKHIGNIFKEGELDANSVCAIFAHTADDKKTYQLYSDIGIPSNIPILRLFRFYQLEHK